MGTGTAGDCPVSAATPTQEHTNHEHHIHHVTDPGHGARHLLIVLVLALAALLFPLSAPVAHAAPPEVTASENPVVIMIKTKEITLTWSLAPGLQLAKLTVTASGTPAPVLDQTVGSPPGKGTAPLTVTRGKTYTAQLKDAFTQQPLGAPLTITTQEPPIAAPAPGCTLKCISDIDVLAHSDYAQMTITTYTPATFTVEVRITKENPDQTWSDGAVKYTAVTTVPTQNWTTEIPGLDPNTDYHYDVRARDTYGHEEFRTNQWFKTPKAY